MFEKFGEMNADINETNGDCIVEKSCTTDAGLNETNAEANEIKAPNEQPSLLPGFKSTCVRIGAMMIVVFAVRGLNSILLTLLSPLYSSWSEFQRTVLSVIASAVFLNFIPIIAGLFILKFDLKNKKREIYAKPQYFGRSFGIFPAGYGLAIACSLITTLIGSLIPSDSPVSKSFNGIQSAFTSTDPASAALMAFHAIVFAPIFEEFWFRGMVLHTLKPYGNGFAIFISALLFGMTHANLGQFLYTTVIGVVLGYVAVQTKSIITTMIMHAMFNSIGSLTSLFLVNGDVREYIRLLDEGIQQEETPAVVTVFLIWTSVVLLFAAVGFIMAIVKLVHFRRYNVEKVQTELSTGKRWGVFLSRVTVIIMLLMAFDTMTFQYVMIQLLKLILKVFY